MKNEKYIIGTELIINGYWIPSKTIIEIIDKSTIIKSCYLQNGTKSREKIDTKKKYGMFSFELITHIKNESELTKTEQEHYC